jgi:hypothetical protein
MVILRQGNRKIVLNGQDNRPTSTNTDPHPRPEGRGECPFPAGKGYRVRSRKGYRDRPLRNAGKRKDGSIFISF